MKKMFMAGAIVGKVRVVKVEGRKGVAVQIGDYLRATLPTPRGCTCDAPTGGAHLDTCRIKPF